MSRAWVVVALGLAGCSEKVPVPYTTVAPTEKPYAAKEGSDNAYDSYVLAAHRTADLVTREDRRRSFTTGFKVRTVSTLAPVLDSVEKATRRSCQFVYVARQPFSTDSPGQDWYLMGRTIAWKVEALLEAHETDEAVDWAIAGLKFGCDLTQGDVEDASIGYGVVELVRQAVRSHQETLGPKQLVRLSEGIAAALDRCGPAEQVLTNQEKAMLASVQMVMDSYHQKQTDKLENLLYKDSRDAVTYLRELKEGDRPAYFAGFAEEAKATAAYARAQADKPAHERQPLSFPEKQSRPWKRFSQHFFAPAFTYLDLRDRFLATTRLWAVDARCRAAALTGSAPAGITHLGALAVDPYSGKPFVYYAAGSDYKVYSVGKDGRDDGGHSDDGYQPDMRLDQMGNS